MKSYDFMRLIVFFDLPVKTKREVKIYTRFRKLLISNGYMMLQYSVYSKILANRDASKQQINFIKKNCPQKGHVRMMLLTEKQYSRMEIVIGGKSRTEEKITLDPFIHL